MGISEKLGALVAIVILAAGASADEREIPEKKRTTLGLYVTSAEAYEIWKESPDAVKILDVRTPEEYIFVGHAEMAFNIPFAFQTHGWDADRKRLVMKRNPDFLAAAQSWAAPTDTILTMCRSGGRSAIAVNALAEAGFTTVYNIIDGMEGDLVDDSTSVFHGKRMRNGWKNAGLPWTYEVDPERVLLSAEPEEPAGKP